MVQNLATDILMSITPFLSVPKQATPNTFTEWENINN